MTDDESFQVHFFPKFRQERVPLFGVDSPPFIFIETVSRAGVVELDVERLHEVEFDGELSFRFSSYLRQNLHIVPVNFAVAIFAVSGQSGFGPLTSTDIAFVFVEPRCQSSPRLADICVVFSLRAVTPSFVYYLSWGQLDFIFPTERILETSSR